MTALVSKLVQYLTLRLILAMWILMALSDAAFVGLLLASFELGLLELEEDGFVGEFLESASFLEIFVLIVFVAPILETLIFQLALLLLAKKLTEWLAKSDSWLPAFLITSLAFAAVHATNAENTLSIYGLLHAVARIPGGIALTLLAIVERRREYGLPVLSVIFLHGLHNAPTTLLFLLSG